MAWLVLMGAIVAEVTATVALRYSSGFTRLLPSLVVALGYGASFYLLAITLKRLSLSTTYAVWSGVGTALIALVGVVALEERLTAAKVLGLVLIIVGVVVLNLAGDIPR